MDSLENNKWIKMKEVHNVMILVPSYKDILFSDGKTKLIDCISNMETPKTLEKFILNIVDINTALPCDSSLWPGCTPLHLAVMFCENMKNETKAEDLVYQFLSQGASIQIQNHCGATPLHLAFHLELDCIVSMLLRKLKENAQEVINMLDNENLSHLHILCTADDHHNSLARKLLLSEQDIEFNINVAYKGKALRNVKPGWTPLHVAVDKLQLSLVELLLKRGASVACRDAQGHTAVHQLFGTNIETNSVVRKVMKPIADLLFAAEQWNESLAEGDGLTRLHVAVWFDDVKSVELLLDFGANIEAAVDVLEDRDLGNLEGCTPLHVAVIKNRYKIVKVLLQRGADMFAKNRNGSPLLLKVLDGDRYFADPFVQLIGNDDKLQERLKNELGLTMLHVACHFLNDKLVEASLKKKDDVNARVPRNSNLWPSCTPLHVFIFSGGYQFSNTTTNIFRMLIRSGCDIDGQDSTGRTAFHLALLKSRPINCTNATIEFLSAGADINILDQSGKSAISYALKHYSDYSSRHPTIHVNTMALQLIFSYILKLIRYTFKMKFIGIDVIDVNERDHTLATVALRNHNITPDLPNQSAFYDEVQATEKVKVGKRGLTLRSFLYETCAISMYPSLTPIDRDELTAYFQSFEYKSFPELSSLFKLQFRKATARLSLIDPARDALKTFISSNFPDLCVDIILKYLSNWQLKQLIEASTEDTDVCK